MENNACSPSKTDLTAFCAKQANFTSSAMQAKLYFL
jgi:hypothetical protein